MNSDGLKKLRIFAASPSDMANERARLVTVVEDLKALAEHVGVTLELVDWQQAVPDLGRLEQIILDQLKPDTWDLFIGILWHRFGTPPGGQDPQTQKEYLSGTEEEFRVAYRLWQKHGRPRVMFYWCKRSIPPDDLDPDQYKRVKEFFAGFAPDAGHPGLYQTFDSVESFERLVRQNLTRFLLDYSEQVKQRVVSLQEVQVFAPTVPPTPRREAFFGREKEMEWVLDALGPEERGWGVVIDGIGGIGKTALAVEAAYRCKKRGLFDAFIFVSAKQKRLEPSGIKAKARAATTLDEFVNETVRALGKPGIAKLTDEDRRRALLDALQTTRALLIYDNLETLTKEEQEALADWLCFLPQGNKAILTTRRRGGEGALWLHLEKLDWEAAREIIAHEAERDARLKEKLQRVQGRWQELYDATGGSPLALKYTLGLMCKRVTLNFDGALAMLRRGAARESPLTEFIYQEARQELGPNDVTALSALSFFVPSATFEALMAVADLSRTALETVLERLDALSLIDVELGEERYSLHPLTRTYVRDELVADANAARAAGMRFARYWLDYAKRYGGEGKESHKTYGRLEEECANLEEAANWLWEMAAVQGDTVGDKDAARMLVDLAPALSQFLWFGGRWDERVQLNARAYEAARALHDWSNAGWRAYYVVWIHWYRARTDDAALWADRCAKAWARGGSKLDQAIAMHIRGLVAQQRKDYNVAERLYQDALAVFRYFGELGRAGPVLNDLGEMAHTRRDYDAAERYFLEALELLRKIGDKGNQAEGMGNLGQLALDREQWTEARHWFEQVLSIAREVGRVEIIAQAQYGLARVWEAEERADLALALAQEALAIYERLQHKDLAGARELVERLRGKHPPP